MWENTVITNAGIELLKNALSGGTITVTAIKSGAGKVDVSALKSQTAVSSIKQSGTVQGVTKTNETIKIGVLFSNAGLSAGYSMTQLGIYAKGSTGSEVLFAISQSITGKEVPAESAMPSWSLVHNFYIKLNNDVKMTATVDPEGYVTFETMQTALNTHTGNKSNPHSVTKSQVGLGNVENKSSATIRGELTKGNVTTALGFTPANQTDMTNAQDAITQLNSDKEWKTYFDDGIKIVTNNQCTIFYIRKSKSLIGGNINDQTLIDLPNGIVFKDEIFAPCEILDGSWTPYGNTGYVNGRNEKITVRCKDSASAGVVIATFVVPTSSIKFN